MHKAAVLQAVREALRRDFENLRDLSKRTRAGSGDDETRTEGKYDTRATEENYLADGQARQAVLAAESLAAFEALGHRPFTPEAPVDLGALVQLEFPGGGETAWFLLGPAAGGLEVTVEGETITVITSDSPLGRQLPGLSRGDATPDAPKTTVRAVL